MSDNNVRGTVLQILEDVVEVPAGTITDEMVLVDDLDVDSLSLVEVMMLIEERLGVKINEESAAKLSTVGDLVARLESTPVGA